MVIISIAVDQSLNYQDSQFYDDSDSDLIFSKLLKIFLLGPQNFYLGPEKYLVSDN